MEESLRHLTGTLLQCLDETEVLHAALQELAVVLEVLCGNTILYHHFCALQNASIDSDQANASGQAYGVHSHFTRNISREISVPLTNSSLTLVSEYISVELDINGLVISPEQCFANLDQRARGCSYQVCLPIPTLTSTWYTVFFCPILDDHGGLLGDILMVRPSHTVFNHDEIHFVQQVANQCAIAIRQSKLYQAAQNQVDELERLNQLKDDFLSTISHELRTPMSNIQMGIDSLERHLSQIQSTSVPASTEDPTSKPLNSDQQTLNQQWQMIQQCLSILKDESQREIELIEDLLNLSRLDAGVEPFLPSSLPLQDWLPHIAEVFHAQIQRQSQRLVLEIPDTLQPITTDFALLERIMTELIQNACKYTPSGECISIAARLGTCKRLSSHPRTTVGIVDDLPISPMDTVSEDVAKTVGRTIQSSFSADPILIIQVSNTGVEIETEECDRIFGKFYRIPSNDPWKTGGTGLGLALVKRLVHHLRGTIYATSTPNQVHLIMTIPLQPPLQPSWTPGASIL